MNDIDTIKNWLGTGSINIFGMPFAGKNTQAEKLASLLDSTVIASGDIFRSLKENEELQAIMATGANIPSDMFFDIVLPYFENPDIENKPIILSEVGRKDGEQENIMKATEESGHPTKAVIFLSMPEEAVWERYENSLSDEDRGDRLDDGNREIVAKRLEKFRLEIQPVIDYYRNLGLLMDIDGTKDRDSVTDEILTALKQRAAAES